jgi:hypothetical protein
LLASVFFDMVAKVKGMLWGPFRKGLEMDNKSLKKKIFVMKETIIDLTPHLLGRVQGADCGLCTGISNWQLSNGGTCNPCLVDQDTHLRTVTTK